MNEQANQEHIKQLASIITNIADELIEDIPNKFDSFKSKIRIDVDDNDNDNVSVSVHLTSIKDNKEQIIDALNFESGCYLVLFLQDMMCRQTGQAWHSLELELDSDQMMHVKFNYDDDDEEDQPSDFPPAPIRYS